jgi:hypothetical protein
VVHRALAVPKSSTCRGRYYLTIFKAGMPNERLDLYSRTRKTLAGVIGAKCYRTRTSLVQEFVQVLGSRATIANRYDASLQENRLHRLPTESSAGNFVAAGFGT